MRQLSVHTILCKRQHHWPSKPGIEASTRIPCCVRFIRCAQAKAQLASFAVPVRLVAGHNLYEEGDEVSNA